MRFFRAFSLLTAAALFIGTLSAAAQTNVMTNIQAYAISAGGSPTSGTVCFIAVDRYSNPIAITRSGGGYYIQGRPFCGTLVSGALTAPVAVPDSNTDSAPGHGYSMVIYDINSKLASSPQSIFGITTASWTLDTYVPAASVSTTSAFTYTTGTSAPTGACVAPALYTNTVTGVLYYCSAGAWLASTGSGPSGTPGPTGAAGAAATVAVGTVTGLASGASPTVTNGGSPNAAIFNFGIPAGPVGATGPVGLTGATGATGATGPAGSIGTVPVFGSGIWSSTTAYSANAIVSQAGTSYISIIAGNNTNTGNTPSISPSAWLQIGNSSAGAVSSITTSGTSGPATLTSGVLNIPQYSGTSVSFLTNGTANATQTTLNLVAGPYVTISNTSGGNVQISGSPAAIALTTTGTSGAATLVAGTLNIPQYSGGGAVSSLTTTGTSGAATLSGGVLNIPQYSGGGAVTSITTTGTSGAATLSGGVLNIPQYSGTGSTLFSNLTSSTNTTAAMLCGTGCTLGVTGTGTINASSVPASGVSGVLSTAQLPTGIPNADLLNASMTLNGTACALGASCSIPSSGTTGFSALASGTNTTAAMVVGSGASLAVPTQAPSTSSTLAASTAYADAAVSVETAARSAAISSASASAANATNLTSGTVPLARLPTAIPNANLLNSATNVNGATCSLGGSCSIASGSTISKLWGYGTSIEAGAGATNAGSTSFFALLAGTTGSLTYNGGLASSYLSYDVFTEFQGYYGSYILPSALSFESGENDTTSVCSTYPAYCSGDVRNTYMAGDAWVAIPTQNKIFASAATRTGTWANDTNFITGGIPGGLSPGTNEGSSVSGSTATFNIPSSSSTFVGLTFGVQNTYTGTFTVSVDGTLVNDNRSGTTTFSSGITGGVAPTPKTYEREEWTVTPGTTHTIVVTTTNSAISTIVAADYLASGNINNGIVFHAGVLANYPSYSTLNPIALAVVNQLRTDGLQVYYVDTVNGVTANGTFYRGVNTTTDVSTSATLNGPGAIVTGHPSDYGNLVYFQDIIATEILNGVNIGTINLIGQSLVNTGQLLAQPYVGTAPPVSGYVSFPGYLIYNAGTYYSGWNFGTAGANLSGSGGPASGAFVSRNFSSSGLSLWNCDSSYTSGTGAALNTQTSFTDTICRQTSTGNTYAKGTSYVGALNFIGNGTATAALGTGVTSVTCATATCTNQRGTFTVVGGTATTGTIATLSWTATSAVWSCQLMQNGGTAAYVLGHSVASTTGFTVSAGVSISGATFGIDYECQP